MTCQNDKRSSGAIKSTSNFPLHTQVMILIFTFNFNLNYVIIYYLIYIYFRGFIKIFLMILRHISKKTGQINEVKNVS